MPSRNNGLYRSRGTVGLFAERVAALTVYHLYEYGHNTELCYHLSNVLWRTRKGMMRDGDDRRGPVKRAVSRFRGTLKRGVGTMITKSPGNPVLLLTAFRQQGCKDPRWLKLICHGQSLYVAEETSMTCMPAVILLLITTCIRAPSKIVQTRI